MRSPSPPRPSRATRSMIRSVSRPLRPHPTRPGRWLHVSCLAGCSQVRARMSGPQCRHANSDGGPCIPQPSPLESRGSPCLTTSHAVLPASAVASFSSPLPSRSSVLSLSCWPSRPGLERRPQEPRARHHRRRGRASARRRRSRPAASRPLPPPRDRPSRSDRSRHRAARRVPGQRPAPFPCPRPPSRSRKWTCRSAS